MSAEDEEVLTDGGRTAVSRGDVVHRQTGSPCPRYPGHPRTLWLGNTSQWARPEPGVTPWVG